MKRSTRSPGSKDVYALRRQSRQALGKGGESPETEALISDIGRMIETARSQVAQTTNAALTTLYWQIGTRHRLTIDLRRGQIDWPDTIRGRGSQSDGA